MYKILDKYPRYYACSNNGRIYSMNTGSILRGYLDSDGYPIVRLYINGRRIGKKVHRLIMETFLGMSKKEVNHIDGNKENNRLSNLEYVTKQQNIAHSVKLGLQSKGSNHSKQLHEDDVLFMRELYKTGLWTYASLAEVFPVKFQNIGYIINRKTWKHI